MIYLMDTDHLSIADADTVEGFNLGRRLERIPPAQIFVSIITYEEQMRGWLAYSARAQTPEQMLSSYRKLRLHVERFRDIPLLDFEERAVAEFKRLQ